MVVCVRVYVIRSVCLYTIGIAVALFGAMCSTST